jgi:hypothetical protein
MKDNGRRLADMKNEAISEVLVVDKDPFWLLYALKTTANRRRDKDMIPVRGWERREKKEKITIQYNFLGSLDVKCFNMK